MVNLDHVISGSFAISSDNREVEVIGGIQFKFGTEKAFKHVKTSGDWFITWNQYSKAVSFLSHTGSVSYPCTCSRFLGFFLPPILEATRVSLTSTRQSGSVLGNVETYFSQTMPNSKICGCIGLTSLVLESLIKQRLNQISEVRTHVTSRIEGFASQRHLIVSTSTSAKSVVESTGPLNVGTP